MAIVLDGTANTVTPLNGALGATTPSTVVATTGTFSGNVTAPNLQGPAFSVYNSVTQALASATEVKLLFPSELFDTNSNFASNRFTPTVAGYYELSCNIYASGNTGFFNVSLFKNGANFVELGRSTGTPISVGGTTLVYANGTTDYFELYGYTSGSALTMGASGNAYFWWTGFLARSA